MPPATRSPEGGRGMSIPETMRAMVLTGHGGPDKLVFHEDWPTPRPGPGEVLIRVLACGMNNTDINTRIGWYAKSVTEGTTAEGAAAGIAATENDAAGWARGGLQFPRIQGADVCGRVVAVGVGMPDRLVGRRVLVDTWFRDWDEPHDLDKCVYFGSEVDGGFAQFAKAPARNVHAIECDLSDAALATFATSYVTAEHMLVRAAVGEGDVVLIPGASGGVGSALVQLARRRRAIPLAMCGAGKADQVKAAGAEAVLGRSPDDLPAALMAAVGRDTVDVVADVVGGALWPRLIDVLGRGGRYTCAGAIAGPIVAFDLRTFYLNNLVFTGATIVPPGLFADLVGYIERGEIRPLLAGTWPLDALGAAQEAFLRKAHVGNFVIIPG